MGRHCSSRATGLSRSTRSATRSTTPRCGAGSRLDGFVIDDGRRLRDRRALTRADLPRDALVADARAADDPWYRAVEWMRSKEITRYGDWHAIRVAAPGGWSFEMRNDSVPDTDDTAEVILALLKSAPADDGAVSTRR